MLASFVVCGTTGTLLSKRDSRIAQEEEFVRADKARKAFKTESQSQNMAIN